jgi:peptidoglycan hydrolase CwlO-like protein
MPGDQRAARGMNTDELKLLTTLHTTIQMQASNTDKALTALTIEIKELRSDINKRIDAVEMQIHNRDDVFSAHMGQLDVGVTRNKTDIDNVKNDILGIEGDLKEQDRVIQTRLNVVGMINGALAVAASIVGAIFGTRQI